MYLCQEHYFLLWQIGVHPPHVYRRRRTFASTAALSCEAAWVSRYCATQLIPPTSTQLSEDVSLDQVEVTILFEALNGEGVEE